MSRHLSEEDCLRSGLPFTDAVPALFPPLPETVTDATVVCGICLEAQDVGSEASRLGCGHWFCYACLEGWFRSSCSCPTCRTTPGTRFELEVDMSAYSTGARVFGIFGKMTRSGLRLVGLVQGSILQQWNAARPDEAQCLRQGDLIRSLNGRPATFERFQAAVACEKVRLEVLRPQASRPVAVRDVEARFVLAGKTDGRGAEAQQRPGYHSPKEPPGGAD